MEEHLMIPVFIITLADDPRSQIRRRNIIKTLKEYNIDFEVINAVNGPLEQEKNCLHRIYNRNITIKKIGIELSTGEIGCAASHLKTYQLIVERKYHGSIIFEDDACPSVGIKRFVNGEWNIPDEIEILSFYTENCFIYTNKFHDSGDVRLHKCKTLPSNTVAYYISRRGAQKILNATNGLVTANADWPVTTSQVEFFVTQPFLAEHNDENYSTIAWSRTLRDKSMAYQAKVNSKGILKSLISFVYRVSLVKYAIHHRKYLGFKNYCFRELSFIQPVMRERLAWGILRIGSHCSAQCSKNSPTLTEDRVKVSI